MGQWYDSNIMPAVDWVASDLSLSNSTSAEMIYDGRYVWAASGATLRKIRPQDGSVIEAYCNTGGGLVLFSQAQGHCNGVSITNMTSDGTWIWMTTSDDTLLLFGLAIEEVMGGEGSTMTILVPGEHPELFAENADLGSDLHTIAFDGSYLWVGVGQEIRVLDPETLTHITRLPLSETPTSMLFDGELMWVVVANSNVLAMSMDRGTIRVNADFSLNGATAMTFDGQIIWIVTDDGGAYFYLNRIDAESLSLGPPIALYSSGAEKPHGIDTVHEMVSDGTNLWIVHEAFSDEAIFISNVNPNDGSAYSFDSIPVESYDPLLIGFATAFDTAHVWVLVHWAVQNGDYGILRQY
jgi:hypothetical protein